MRRRSTALIRRSIRPRLNRVLNDGSHRGLVPGDGPAKRALADPRIIHDHQKRSEMPGFEIVLAGPARKRAERCVLRQAQMEADCVVERSKTDHGQPAGRFAFPADHS